MNDFCKTRFLGLEAINYIEDCLKNGKSLSENILKCIKFFNGKVLTYLPENIKNQEAIKFDLGGKFDSFYKNKKKISLFGIKMEKIINCDMFLVNEITSFLKISADNICVIENTLETPEDPGVKKSNSRLFFYNNQVFYFLIHDDIDNNNIHKTIKESFSIPIFIGTMTSYPENFDIVTLNRKYISEDILKLLAERTEKIFVGAYDGEGYLIWSKK